MPFDTAALTRKIGPLPVWGYGAIVAGGAWAYHWWTTRGGSADSGGQDTGALGSYDYFGVPADDGTGANYADNTGVPANTGGSDVPSSGGTTAPTDNQAWISVASNYLVGFNYDPIAVNNALIKYLQGEQLTASERSLVNQAIARFGVPPEGVPVSPGNPPTPPPIIVPPDDRPGTPVPPTPKPPPITPKPVPVPPPPAARYTTVTVAKWKAGGAPWNSTMWGIAKHYGYGSASTNYVPIWNDSKNAALKSKRKSPSKIQAGDIVYVKLK